MKLLSLILFAAVLTSASAQTNEAPKDVQVWTLKVYRVGHEFLLAQGSKDEAVRPASDATAKLEGGPRLTNGTAGPVNSPLGSTLIALYRHPKQMELAEGSALHVKAYRAGVHVTEKGYGVERWIYVEKAK